MTTIRPAAPADIDQIMDLIADLAEYERESDAVVATADQIRDALFGGSATPSGQPAAYCLVVDGDGELAGFALWFLNFSTWLGRHGVYLEDLFVRPRYRGRGFGRGLLATLARHCRDHGYGRLELSVLDWNTPAIDFYRSQGAQWMGDWTVNRISGTALDRLADQAPPSP